MKSSCISYPEHEPLILIRASQVQICDGNHCAAALLSYFEYWHNIRLAQAAQAEHHNRVAESHGEMGTQDTSLLQYHTEEKIEAGLLQLYGRTTIRKALAVLVAKDYVSLHANPNKRYGFDRTHYFLFHPEVVQANIRAIPHQVKVPDREGQNTAPGGRNTVLSGKSTATIPEITPEITSEIPLPAGEESAPARKEQKPQLMLVKPSKPARPSRRCPPDYVPSPRVYAWALAHHPEMDVDAALEALKDYEFASGHTDWDATLRTWIRKDAERMRRRIPSPPPGTSRHTMPPETASIVSRWLSAKE